MFIKIPLTQRPIIWKSP